MIFCGSGSTGAVDKLVGILGIRVPSGLDDRYGLTKAIPPDERPVVFVGPFEHHSNELPWRESIADVIEIRRGRGRPHRPRGARGGARTPRSAAAQDRLVLGRIERHGDLLQHAARSPTSSTGTARSRSGTSRPPRRTSRSRCTRTARGTRSRTRTRSSSARTSSSAGRARPESSSCAASCSRTGCRTSSGGGTVAYVNPTEHRYLDDPEHREEGGTPAIVESIRAGLVFQLKQAVGVRRHPRARGGLLAPRGRALETEPEPRDPRQPRRGAALDRLVRRAPRRRPLPAPQLRRRGS